MNWRHWISPVNWMPSFRPDTLRHLFLTDPLARLRPDKDSSVALMQAAQRAAIEVWWAEPRHLYGGHGHGVGVTASPLWLETMHAQRDAGWTVPHPWYREGAREPLGLDAFALVWMRRDPPVDAAYGFAASLLAEAERRGVRVINHPASLLIWNEKLSALQFDDLMAPTLVSAEPSQISAFIACHQEVVLKPLEGRAGRGVLRANATMDGLGALLELVTAQRQLAVMVQAYLPAVQQGDKRILLVNGEPVGAVNRRPRQGEFRSNLAVGGTPEACELGNSDRTICTALAEPLRQAGLAFVGIDVIGDRLSEINVTSPTGLREIEWLAQFPAADVVLERLLEG